MRLLIQAAAGALLASVLSAGAAAAGPAARHTSVGNAAAAATLLKSSDLGKGWQAGPSGTPGLKLTCPGYAPSGKGIVETGAAGTPSFAGGSVGPFVQQTTSIYASAAQASAYWARSVKPGLVACVTQSVEAIRRQGVKVAIEKQGSLAVTKPTSMTVGYRVVATLTSKKAGSQKLYFDVVLVGSGKALSELTLSSFVEPVPAEVESALAALVAKRLGGVPTA